MTDPASTSLRAPGFALGEAGDAYAAALDQARDGEWVTRLFDRDVTLWSDDPTVGAAISDRLGWLDAPVEFADRIGALEAFEIQGIKNNIPAVLAILRSEPFRAGRVHTGLIPEVLAKKK